MNLQIKSEELLNGTAPSSGGSKGQFGRLSNERLFYANVPRFSDYRRRNKHRQKKL